MANERLAVVTGSSSGLGLAVAQVLLERGWRVLGLARRDAPLRHERYAHARLDLADTVAVQRYFGTDFARAYPAGNHARIGLVSNAALIEPLLPQPRIALDALAQHFVVNAVVPIWLLGFFRRYSGTVPLRIVNVSTGAARTVRPAMTAYCASKAALLSAARTFETEDDLPGAPPAALLSYEPGVLDTPMQAAMRAKTDVDFPARPRFAELHAQGKLVDPTAPAREIADFLESDGAPRFSEARYAG